jgi:8-amino-7-oxononanoate synthase
MNGLDRVLQSLQAQDLYRQRQVLDSPQGIRVTVDGRDLLSFCSNDYLGLASDARIAAAFAAAAAKYGFGAGASHLVTGHSREHHELERELAEFVGAPRALLFSTGYMANLGVVSALLGRDDLVVEDRLNHASLIDAVRLSRARVARYHHGDADHARARLQAAGATRMLATDAVFSMDGDRAPLAELTALARETGAWLLADDAHGLGVVGRQGRGSFSQLDIPLGDPIIYMGTLGKAIGTFGAFVAGSEKLIETLVQRARTYIYTTALPPAVAAATRASLRIVRDEEWRRERLRENIDRFVRAAHDLGLTLLPSESPIQALVLGESKRALLASQHLRERGIVVPAIRPPTVPNRTARLRITFSALHGPDEVDCLLDVLAEAVPAA